MKFVYEDYLSIIICLLYIIFMFYLYITPFVSLSAVCYWYTTVFLYSPAEFYLIKMYIYLNV